MKNADMPASPSVHCTMSPENGDMVPDQWAGLSKREHFAAMAMPRIDVHGVDEHDLEQVARVAARMAVQTADALLAELEKTS